MSDYYLPAEWYTGILERENFHLFKTALFTKASEELTNDINFGALGFLIADDEWAALPGITMADGTITAAPTIPAIPVAPAPSDGTAGDDRRFMIEQKEFLRLRDVRKEIILVCTKLKDILRNSDVVGRHRAVVEGSGDLIQRMNDSAKIMFGRLQDHLETPDDSTFALWKTIYCTSGVHMDVSEWERQELLAHTQLAKYGQELSRAQRLDAFRTCYRNSPPVKACLDDYGKTTPVLARQTFANAMAFVKAQEPNIKAALTREAVGFPSPLAATVLEAHMNGGALVDADEPVAAAAAPRMYTQDQLDQAVADAKAQFAPKKQLLYCWLHGYQNSHCGSDCHGIAIEKSLRAWRDSRPDVDGDMTFSHPGCRHSPRCISVDQAKKATGPRSFPKQPGNKFKPGDKP